MLNLKGQRRNRSVAMGYRKTPCLESTPPFLCVLINNRKDYYGSNLFLLLSFEDMLFPEQHIEFFLTLKGSVSSARGHGFWGCL